MDSEYSDEQVMEEMQVWRAVSDTLDVIEAIGLNQLNHFLVSKGYKIVKIDNV